MHASRHKFEHLISDLDKGARVSGAQDVLEHVVQVRGLLADNATAVDLALATARLVESSMSMKFRQYIEDTQRGEKVLRAAREGHTVVHGTKKEKAARYEAYQRSVDEKHEAKPFIKSWRRLSDLVAQDHGCCGRTIREHTKNPLKKVGKVPALSHSKNNKLSEN